MCYNKNRIGKGRRCRVDKLMVPFIMIYHAVHSVFMFPKKLFGKTEDAIIGLQDQNAFHKEQKENEIQTSEEKEEEDNFKGIRKETFQRKQEPLFSFRYTIINSFGKKEQGTFEAETLENAREFLVNEGYQVVDIKPRQKLDIDLFANGKIKVADLSFSLTQLATYLKAGIPLIDSVRILAKQSSKPELKKAFEKLVYDLLKGESLSVAMEHQDKKFPKLLVNMVKTAEMTGDLASILDDMAEYYTSMNKTRKQMISAMTYPTVILILALCVLVFMLIYIVPSFVNMFESQDAALPWITVFVMGASNFVKNNILWILLSLIIVICLFVYLYKNVKAFRKVIQTFVMHIPVFGKIVIYNEVTNFTKTFASLLNHGVFITDSMDILSKITNNEVYKEIIDKTIRNLGKGESISTAFKGEWAFPIVAYEMIVTGESTGQLGLMMEKVSEHFQTLHKTIIDQLKSLIEPIMIAFLAVIVGVILLSIVVPMFDIYSKIQ